MNAKETINLFAQLGDMKEVAYKNTLAITTVIELLVEKGILSREEIAQRAQKLDATGD